MISKLEIVPLQELGLNKVPAPTTLRVFADRMNANLLELMIENGIDLTRKRKQ